MIGIPVHISGLCGLTECVKMKWLRRIGELERQCAQGDVVPRGWGFVRGMHYQLNVYIAPIPLNFVLAAWHWFYWRLVAGLGWRADYINTLRRRWMDEGWKRGEEHGYRNGFKHAAIILQGARPSKPEIAMDTNESERQP